MKLEFVLNEARPSRTMEIASQLKQLPFVEKVLNIHALVDGMTALVRGVDGNAYEIEIRPASDAHNHQHLTKPTNRSDRATKKEIKRLMTTSDI